MGHWSAMTEERKVLYLSITIIILGLIGATWIHPITIIPVEQDEYREVEAIEVWMTPYPSIHPEYSASYYENGILITYRYFSPLDQEQVFVGNENLVIIHHGEVWINMYGKVINDGISYSLQLTQELYDELREEDIRN